MSIRQRIFLGIVLLFGIGFYFLIDFIVDDIELRYRESTEEPLVDTARVLASLAASTAEQGRINTELFRSSFADIHAQRFSARIFGLVKTRVDLRIYITDQAGLVLFDSDNGRDEGRDYSQWRDVYRTLRGDYGARTSISVKDAAIKMLYIASPIVINGDLIGVLSVGKPTYSSNQFVEAAQRKLIIGGAAVCLSLIAIGLLLGLWVTRPIQQLTRYARNVRDGKRVKLPALGSGEMAELGAAFEEMRDALEGKRYVENYVQTLTHEIKSPVSAIRGAVELLSEDLPQQQRTVFLQNIHVESDRITRIVENLLLLTSLESKQEIECFQRLSIDELLYEIEQILQPSLNAKRLVLIIDGTRGCTLHAEAFLIRQALINLLQNAIEFSPADEIITLSVVKDVAAIRFEIRDNGPGIPDYAQERIFERFYSLKRPDTGRKSSGLGLSLVKEIVTLHQGSISIASHSEGGTVALITFPLI